MALKQEVSEIINAINSVRNIGFNITRLTYLDIEYLKASNYKFNRSGNLTNNWCILSTKRIPETAEHFGRNSDISDSIDTKRIQPINYINGEADNELEVDAIFLYGLNISVNKSAKVIETQVAGLGSPVYQQYTDNTYDVSIGFTESGPIFFQQNVKIITDIINILNSPQTLYITNMYLNNTFGIKEVIVKNHSIGQDTRFYSQSPISISLKQDLSTNILAKKL